MLLCSTTLGEVNGSLGALVERGPKSSNLAGIFIEVNNQKYGGYFSIAGMSKEEVANQFRIFTCVNLGITYFMKERLGIVLFGGLFENSYRKYDIPDYYFYRNRPGTELVDDGSGGYLDDWDSEWYFTYGGGLLFYTLDTYVTLHLKANYIPKYDDVFVGVGIGVHLRR